MSILDDIDYFAAVKPDTWALIHPQFRITWRQFNNLIHNCAAYISNIGIRSESIVGISQKKSLMNLTISLALMKLGISFVDVSDDEINFLETKERLGIAYVLSDRIESYYGTPTIKIESLSDFTNVKKISNSKVNISELVSFFIKTSGTTGKPKYISLTQSKISARFDTYSTSLGFGESDLFWTPISTSFSSSKLRYFAAIHGGATLVIGCKLTPRSITFLDSIGITKIFCTPSQLFKLVEIGIPLPTCDCISASTSFISEKLRKEFKSIVSNNLYVVYGTSESGLVTEADPSLQLRSPNTVGIPYPGAQVQIVDGNDLIVPAGVAGNIRIMSPGLCENYFRDTSMSELNFRNGWFYPGDLGYFDTESSLILLGRSDDMFIFDGVNIHPIEIEDSLESHHGVIEAAAFSVPHERYGEVPVAAVITCSDVSEVELIEHCTPSLGPKTPKRIFMTEEFPRNEMGKLLRKELTNIYSGNLLDPK
jgi:acyl-coenzyme A synthetase/AMP-(fatty) acid ligase